MNVLCIIDQDHERSVIVVDHSRKFKDIQSMANPQRMSCNIENGRTIITKLRKMEEEIFV